MNEWVNEWMLEQTDLCIFISEEELLWALWMSRRQSNGVVNNMLLWIEPGSDTPQLLGCREFI